MKKQVVVLVVAVLLAAVSGLTSAQSKLSGTIDYLVWGDANSNAIEEMVIAAFEAKYPGVKVNLVSSSGERHITKLMTMIAANTAPDVAIVDGYDYQSLAVGGSILDVTDWAKRDNIRGEMTHPAYWAEMVVNGRLYSVANVRGGHLIMPFNKTLFAEVGAAGPYDGAWTWNSMLDAAKRITRDTDGDGNNDRWGVNLGLTWAWWPWVWMNGGEIFNADQTRVTLDTPQAAEALQWLADSDLVHRVAGSEKELHTGRLGLRTNWGTGDINRLRNQDAFEWDIAPLPSGAKGYITASKGNEIIIPVNATNKELAWEFMKFIGSEEAQYIYGREGRFFPNNRRAAQKMVTEAMANNQSPAHIILLTEEKGVRPLPMPPSYRALEQVWRNELRAVARGEKSALEAGTIASEASVAILAEYKAKYGK